MTTNQIIPEIMPEAIVDRHLNPIRQEFAHADVSTRYNHVTTLDVVNALRDDGWEVAKTAVQNVRREDRRGYQKHFVWLRSATADLQVGDSELRLLMVNAHDGTCAYRLLAGVHRKVCSNGLIVKVGDFAYISIRHSDMEIREKAIEGAKRISALAPEVNATIKKMETIELTPNQQFELARQSIKAIWPDKSETYVTPTDLLGARRNTDEGVNLWLTYNRIQENALRGGLATETGRRTRAINGAIRDVDVNRNLFDIDMTFAR